MTSIIVIEGGHDVAGDIHVSGSKNAGLALMAASLLTSGRNTLEGVPSVSDIDSMGQIIQSLGANIIRASDSLHIDTTNLGNRDILDRLTGSLRGSILVLGPLVARFGFAKICLPGGCIIGPRPIEEHLRGLKKMGARIKITKGTIEAYAPSSLHGATLQLKTPSVTGTMNLMMAACLASGMTYIYNAAREPEVTDLVNCLISMGVKIREGVGAEPISIFGCGRLQVLRPYQYKVMEDRIEAGTFLVLGAMAGNPLTVHGCSSQYQTALIEKLRAVGAQIDVRANSITARKAICPVAVDIQTGPYPAYPTDLQPQLMALLSIAHGTSRITETVFEMRFNQLAGLAAMGADICVDERVAVVSGVRELSGNMVTATDLRAGASLILAAIAAKGVTVIQDTQHIDRGYDGLEIKLENIGVSIKRVHTFDEGTQDAQIRTAVPALSSTE